MKKKIENYAFIDAQNVNLSIRDQGWKLDWKRLKVYLNEKYSVGRIYMFIGYVPSNEDMYTFFQELGYTLIFKPVLNLKSGQTKGNVDAELVLQAMIDYKKYDKAIIISGDGDFSCLVRYLYKKNKLDALIVPNEKKYSTFLKKVAKERIDSLSNLRKKLEYKERNKKKKRTN